MQRKPQEDDLYHELEVPILIHLKKILNGKVLHTRTDTKIDLQIFKMREELLQVYQQVPLKLDL